MRAFDNVINRWIEGVSKWGPCAFSSTQGIPSIIRGKTDPLSTQQTLPKCYMDAIDHRNSAVVYTNTDVVHAYYLELRHYLRMVAVNGRNKVGCDPRLGRCRTERDSIRLSQVVSPRIRREDIPARSTHRIDAFFSLTRRQRRAFLQAIWIGFSALPAPKESVPSTRRDVRRFRTRRSGTDRKDSTGEDGEDVRRISRIASRFGIASLDFFDVETKRARSTSSHGSR